MPRLTATGMASTMKRAMRKWMTRASPPVGWMLALVFAITVSTSCFTGQQMTIADMACCAAMGHDCGSMGQGEDCCAGERSTIVQSARASRVSVAAPAPALAAILRPIPYAPHRVDSVRFSAVPQRPSGIPKYLRTAALLI